MVDGEPLPEAVQAGIDAFVASAKAAFSDNLISIVLFGSAVEGRLRATSDVNLIIVLNRAEPAQLDAVGPAYRLAHATIRLSVMFILDSEIALAAEAFAVKFFDVSARHRVLYGSDPFAQLEVDREAARRRLRQVLINLTLRLREHRALSGAFADQLALSAADAVGPLRVSAALLLSLETGRSLPPREALAELGAALGLDKAVATVTRARELGGEPEGGGAAAIEAALEIAAALEARTQELGSG